MASKKTYEKSFFIQMNMQNPPKPKAMDWYVRKADASSIEEYTVESYEFTKEKREDSIGEVEGFNPSLNFRMAFLPEEGHYWISRDFSGQELRIMANISGEPTWINAFLNNQDLHKETAITLWNDPGKRKAAKAINFGLLYGKTAKGLASDLNITEEEAQSYIDRFFEKLPAIKAYIDRAIRNAENTKDTVNFYGRRRRMLSFVNAYGKISSAGKRRISNFPVQSIGADITKLALIKIHDNILENPKYKGKVFFMNTIHDEINLSAHKSIVKEIANLQGKMMEHIMPGKPVPIITELEIGNSMGLCWKFTQDEKTLELTPKFSKIY